MSATNSRGHRDLLAGRRRRRARRGLSHHADARRRTGARMTISIRWLKQARRHRPRRARHARADQAHPRTRHAERDDRARAGRQVRSRSACKQARQGVAGPRRARSRQGRDHARRATSSSERRWRWPMGVHASSTKPQLHRRRHRLWREAQHPARARRHRRQDHRAARDARRRKKRSRTNPTACCSPTAPAIPPRPASTPRRKSRNWSIAACR